MGGGDTRDKGYSGMDDGRFFLEKAIEIIEYLPVRLAGILSVDFRVGNLDVIIY
jgi:hypothetical protein